MAYEDNPACFSFPTSDRRSQSNTPLSRSSLESSEDEGTKRQMEQQQQPPNGLKYQTFINNSNNVISTTITDDRNGGSSSNCGDVLSNRMFSCGSNNMRNGIIEIDSNLTNEMNYGTSNAFTHANNDMYQGLGTGNSSLLTSTTNNHRLTTASVRGSRSNDDFVGLSSSSINNDIDSTSSDQLSNRNLAIAAAQLFAAQAQAQQQLSMQQQQQASNSTSDALTLAAMNEYLVKSCGTTVAQYAAVLASQAQVKQQSMTGSSSCLYQQHHSRNGSGSPVMNLSSKQQRAIVGNSCSGQIGSTVMNQNKVGGGGSGHQRNGIGGIGDGHSRTIPWSTNAFNTAGPSTNLQHLQGLTSFTLADQHATGGSSSVDMQQQQQLNNRNTGGYLGHSGYGSSLDNYSNTNSVQMQQQYKIFGSNPRTGPSIQTGAMKQSNFDFLSNNGQSSLVGGSRQNNTPHSLQYALNSLQLNDSPAPSLNSMLNNLNDQARGNRQPFSDVINLQQRNTGGFNSMTTAGGGSNNGTTINNGSNSNWSNAQMMLNNEDSSASSTPEVFSKKVFVGGLPPDIDEEEIHTTFLPYGNLMVDWPHKAESKSYFPPKGYAFLIFQTENAVQMLISNCLQENGKYFMYVSSPTMREKPVQIRPWKISDADFVLNNELVMDLRKTVFVGGVPRPLKAFELARILDRLYGNVCYAAIDIDPELKYPKGAGRVSFSDQQSYIAAISARFVQLQHDEIDKRVEVKPYVLDDQQCDECGGERCGGKVAPYFCANVTCLQYFCELCWNQMHSIAGREYHKPLVKEGSDRPRTMGFRFL